MQQIIVSVRDLHTQALQNALSSTLGALSTGVTTARDQQVNGVMLSFADQAQPADITNAQAIAAAHDPVFLSADKTSIQANGTDTVTILVQAPKQGAVPVTLSVSNGSSSSDWGPFTLNQSGAGSDTFVATDPGVYVITVKNPANRSTDQITIIAR